MSTKTDPGLNVRGCPAAMWKSDRLAKWGGNSNVVHIPQNGCALDGAHSDTSGLCYVKQRRLLYTDDIVAADHSFRKRQTLTHATVTRLHQQGRNTGIRTKDDMQGNGNFGQRRSQ